MWEGIAESRGRMASKRMAKDERRRQLLSTALAIVRDDGTAALTLGRLAERAGVTKPIAYEHFGTRAGLLIALYQDYDDRTTRWVRAALKSGGRSLEQVAAILAQAYVDCVLEMGPEYGAIYDALSATEETAEFRRRLRAFHIGEFRKPLAPFVKLPRRKLETLLIGIVGGASSLSHAAAAGRLTRAEALSALTRLIVATLKAE